jgi:hypothetical protein
MPSLKRHEGYLLIDNSAGPGLSEADIDPAWRAAGKAVHAVPEGKKHEAATITCHHCQAVVILNPARTRERPYCPKCDHYICDTCESRRALTRECVPFKKVLDELQEQNARLEQLGLEASPILLP